MKPKTLKTFWNYYGGKWRAAPRYPKPLHKTIIEPFAGAAGYSLRHYQHDVILIDSYEPVAGLWDYLIKATPEEILALPMLEPDQKVNDLNVCQEAKWLIGFRSSPGIVSPVQSPSTWSRNFPKQTGVWSPEVRDRVAFQVPLIKHWQVIHGPYEESPNMEATWFVDPPYNNKAGSFYPHSGLNYSDLADWCRSRDGQVMVCENEGADWLPFKTLYSLPSSSGKHRPRKRSAEVLWTNEES